MNEATSTGSPEKQLVKISLTRKYEKLKNNLSFQMKMKNNKHKKCREKTRDK